MKIHTTIKNIRNNWNHVFRCGYCDLQHIFRYEEPQFYNSGVYGWNCDIYVDYGRDIAITTGYRNMAGRMIPADLIRKYSDIAEAISKDWRKPYTEIKKALDDNREKFLDELTRLESLDN